MKTSDITRFLCSHIKVDTEPKDVIEAGEHLYNVYDHVAERKDHE